MLHALPLIRAKIKGARAYAATLPDVSARFRIIELCEMLEAMCDFLEKQEA